MQNREFIIERTILKIGNRLNTLRNEDLKQYDITSAQSETLLFFDRNKNATISDLKEHLQVSHQAASKIIDKLKTKDFVYAVPSVSDARANNIYLTAQGQDLCDKLKKTGSDVGHHLLKDFSTQEKQLLLEMLERIKKNL